MSEASPQKRVAFSPGEFAALFGKSQTWGYRQIYAGKVRAITEYGRIQIPAAEVERILGTAGTYNGLKRKVPKKNAKVDGWRLIIERRRKAKPTPEKEPIAKSREKLRPVSDNARQAAMARLTRRKDSSR